MEIIFRPNRFRSTIRQLVSQSPELVPQLFLGITEGSYINRISASQLTEFGMSARLDSNSSEYDFTTGDLRAAIFFPQLSTRFSSDQGYLNDGGATVHFKIRTPVSAEHLLVSWLSPLSVEMHLTHAKDPWTKTTQCYAECSSGERGSPCVTCRTTRRARVRVCC